MINRRLTTKEAAARLGVKPETLYAYVSRGLLQRERTPDGSTFDPVEVARLGGSSRNAQPPGVEVRPDQPIFITELTLIEDGRLYYRGLDAVELSRQRAFEQVAEWLWTGSWLQVSEPWPVSPRLSAAITTSTAQAGDHLAAVERLAVAVMAASVADELRHDLNPGGVPVTGRALLASLVGAFAMSTEAPDEPGSISARLWPRLSPLPSSPGRQKVLEAALVLSADHEMAPSTLAARVAASFRADPYAVVMTGLGPASGGWPSGSSGAPSEVENLLQEARSIGAEAAIGSRLKRTGLMPHGFGMPLYPEGDPRGAEMLARIDELDPSSERAGVVRDVLAVAARREFPPPNIDMGLGAISFCAEMQPGAGQAITTFAKIAGWLAHAMEEYQLPTRFRARADYVGTRPSSPPARSSDESSEG